MHMQNLDKLHQFVLKILGENKIPASIKDHNLCYKFAKIDA